jgi:hypothetical protein
MSTAADLEDLPTVSTSDANAPLFDTQLVLDSRLAVKSSLTFGVEKSGQQITAHQQMASSATTSGCSFEVTVPSLSTIISRKVNIRSELVFTIAGNTTVDDYLVKWGINCAAAPFGFQQMAATSSCTINNSNYTFESGDLLAMVLRQLPKDVLDEYVDTTPVFLDNYANYADCLIGTAEDAVPKRNSPFLGNESSFLGQEGRGSYNLIAISAGNTIGTAAALAKSVDVTLSICEPLIMSPFLLSTHADSNAQGIYGVQGMAFNFNFLAGNLSRAIRGVFPAGTSVSLKSINQAKTYLDFTYITPHASLKLPSRNLIPYIQFVKFIDPVPDIPANVSPFGPVGWTTVTSNSHSLTSIPDYITVGVRRISSGRNSLTADCWLPIQSCVINFNNTPGIMSGVSQQELWNCSKNNGISIPWNLWKGYALETSQLPSAGAPTIAPVATTGSLLKLQFGRDININSDWLSAASIGQFSISVQLTVADNTQYGAAAPATLAAGTYEMCLMFQQSGFIVTSLGSSSQYTGILSKAQVLDASQQDPVNRAAVERVYGAGMHSSSSMAKGAGYSAGKMSAGKSNMKDRFV